MVQGPAMQVVKNKNGPRTILDGSPASLQTIARVYSTKPGTSYEESKMEVVGEPQMMGSAHDLMQMSEWPIILTEGGDCRLPLDPKTGTNKYHSSPYVPKDVAFRGSCTCNSPSQLGHDAALEVYNQMKAGKITAE